MVGLTTTLATVPGQSNSGGTETQNFCYDEQNRLVWSGNGGTQPGAGSGTCGTGTLGNTLQGAGYTAPYQYTNLGQIWQGPLNGQGTSEQYLYCDVNHPHQLSGLYPVGTTCANRSGAVYTAGYDAWGNETSRSTGGVTATLSYDALNRLVGYNAGSNGQEWYLYNAAGERVLKRSLSGSTTTLTVYAFGLQELSYSGAGALASQIDYYVLAGHLIGSTNGTTTTYYLTDGLGSVLTSLSTSAIVGQQVYGPYGNTRYQVGTMGTTKGYTGQFHDAVSGLDYYNARYYDPVVGQFLSVDNVQGNALGYDPYSYVGGNPETLTDPTGYNWWDQAVSTFQKVATRIVAQVVVNVLPAIARYFVEFTIAAVLALAITAVWYPTLGNGCTNAQCTPAPTPHSTLVPTPSGAVSFVPHPGSGNRTSSVGHPSTAHGGSPSASTSTPEPNPAPDTNPAPEPASTPAPDFPSTPDAISSPAPSPSFGSGGGGGGGSLPSSPGCEGANNLDTGHYDPESSQYGGEYNVNCDTSLTNALSNSANGPYSDGKYTNAGRALLKHASRVGGADIWGPASGSPSWVNARAADFIDQILSGGDTTWQVSDRGSRYGVPVLDGILPDGRGARWALNDVLDFIGFLNP